MKTDYSVLPGLQANSLSVGESVIMGVAGSGPAYSLAATTAMLISIVGVSSPACLLYCAFLIYGIVFSFRQLNQFLVNTGASYAWVGKIFSPVLGFLSGWALMVAAVVFMVSGTIPAATATLLLITPALGESQTATVFVATVWIVIIGFIVMKGIKISSYMQVGFTIIEVGIIGLLITLEFVNPSPQPARELSFSWFSGQDLTAETFAGGALVALFAFSGWDVTANLNEETRGGGRNAGVGGMVAVLIVAGLFVGFNVITLLILNDSEIQTAGVNILFIVASRLLPTPWDYLAVVAVMLSTLGTLETSVLQFTRTMYSMARDNALNPRYARLHASYRTPYLATNLIVILGVILLLLSLYLPSVKVVVDDSVKAVGLQIAFYYGVTGLACAWLFRRKTQTSISKFISVCIWPSLGAIACILIGLFSVPTLDVTTNLIGIGSIMAGFIPYLWNRIRYSNKHNQAS